MTYINHPFKQEFDVAKMTKKRFLEIEEWLREIMSLPGQREQIKREAIRQFISELFISKLSDAALEIMTPLKPTPIKDLRKELAEWLESEFQSEPTAQ